MAISWESYYAQQNSFLRTEKNRDNVFFTGVVKMAMDTIKDYSGLPELALSLTNQEDSLIHDKCIEKFLYEWMNSIENRTEIFLEAGPFGTKHIRSFRNVNWQKTITCLFYLIINDLFPGHSAFSVSVLNTPALNTNSSEQEYEQEYDPEAVVLDCPILDDSLLHLSRKDNKDPGLEKTIISPVLTLQDPELLLRQLLSNLLKNPDGHHSQYQPLLEDYEDNIIVENIFSTLTPDFKTLLHQSQDSPYDLKL